MKTPTELDRTHRLMTGGTGFMGSHFLLSLYAKTRCTTVLTRGKNTVDAKGRLTHAIERAACAYSVSVDTTVWDDRINAVIGDICAPSVRSL